MKEQKELTIYEVADWIRALVPYLENPVILAPKNCIKEGQELKPGTVIEFDSALQIHEPQVINQLENLKLLVDLYKTLLI